VYTYPSSVSAGNNGNVHSFVQNKQNMLVDESDESNGHDVVGCVTSL